MTERYKYGTNINGNKGLSGIIDLSNMDILCYCQEDNAKIIIEALNQSSDQSERIKSLLWNCDFNEKHHDYAMATDTIRTFFDMPIEDLRESDKKRKS